MATLYSSTIQARRVLLVVLIFFLLVTLLGIYNNATSEDNAPPAVGGSVCFMPVNRIFDEIPEAEIPSLNITPTATFSLEGIHSRYPDAAYVYKIEEPREKLLSFETALETVNALGFEANSYSELSENDFRWTKSNETKILEYNKSTQVWNLETLYFDNPEALSRKTLLESPEEYIGVAGRINSSLNFNSFGMSNAIVQATFARLGLDGIFVNTNSQDEAEYVLLNYYRNILSADLINDDDLNCEGIINGDQLLSKTYSNDPRYGQLKIVASNNARDLPTDLFEIDYVDYDYETNIETEVGSYAVITADEAWTKAQQGRGSLTFLLPQGANSLGDFESLNVRRFVANASQTELAYWESDEWNGYLYPIYVFFGRAELEDGRQASFIIYVDAIKRLT